ncbi:hypothetical protein G4B88_003709 [Cannabis sativa]|uniref:NPH3 domain-containing protein n=1 Tax=Cannabis sativa TaxID=3483 RepID=A0A7J6FA55_CANSA|nr:hypothetical protein G4B88_003709 [Cannabis sativa]
MEDASVFESDSPHSPFSNSNCLSWPNANLKLAKFLVIADSLPDHARTLHDGLYRAIDIYLKITRTRQKETMQIDRLSKAIPEAGGSRSQNERLPLQSIVQVLYFEQIRLRNTLCSSYGDEDGVVMGISSGALSAAMSPRDNYASLEEGKPRAEAGAGPIRMRLNDLERDMDMEKSSSRKFMTSFSRKIGKLGFFGHSSSRGSSSPSKHSYRTDSKVIERTCASTD